MAIHSIKQTVAASTLPPAQAQLDSLVELAVRHFNEDLTALCARLAAAMLEVDDPALDAAAVYHRVRAGNLLKAQSYAFIHLASAAIGAALRKDALGLRPQPTIALAASADALTLVPMEEMDLSVTFATLSRPYEAGCAELLATLNVRLGFLLERDTLRVSQNPFRPDLVLLALHQAWCEFSPEADSHAHFAPILKPGVGPDFAPLYEALNGALEASGGQALRIRKRENAARAKAERANSKAALARQLRQFLAQEEAFENDVPLIPDLPGMPQGKGGWRPSGAEGFDVAPPVAPHLAPQVAPHLAPTHDARVGHSVAAGGFVGAGGHGGHGGQLVGNGAPHAAWAGAAPQSLAPAAAIDAGAVLGAVAQAQHLQPAGLLELLARLPALASLASSPMVPMGPAALPAAAAGSGAGPAATGAPPHNVFYLPRLKQAMPAGALSRGDATTLDLLSRIFDTVYLDESIPQPTRELIQYLQAPVLKAALLDKDFFYQEHHPARRMIDVMSRMGWEQRSPDDPLFQAMQRGVERVGRENEAGADVFAEAVAELEASLASEEQAASSTMAAPIAAALKQEKVVAATRSAKTAVALRVGGGQLSTVVEAFLQQKWTAVLTIAYSVETEKPGAVGNATRTMDDLIWSVRPKITVEQRKQMIARLPGLLATLNKWLDIIKWQDAERLQFFAALAECHASIVRAPIELSPERQLEVALEAAQQDAMRRLENEQAMAAAEQLEVARDELDPARLAVDDLERGAWLEFASAADASTRTVKLAWISPLRSLFIFSTVARKEAFSMEAGKLLQAWQDGRVRVVRQDGMVAQALADALAENGAAVAA